MKLILDTAIQDAYYGVTPDSSGHFNTVYLRTSADLTSACRDSFSGMPNMRWITRYSSTDPVPVEGVDPSPTAAAAARSYPDIYKQIGDYVYGYGHMNGVVCDSQGATLADYAKAFASLQAL